LEDALPLLSKKFAANVVYNDFLGKIEIEEKRDAVAKVFNDIRSRAV